MPVVIGCAALALVLGFVAGMAWRHSWTRQRMQIRRLPEHVKERV
jgi:hypothetical protein